MHAFRKTFTRYGNSLFIRLIHEASGRVMETYTTQPAVQLYTANYLDDMAGKDGAVYNQHSSLCLETQNYPDAINHVSFLKYLRGAFTFSTCDSVCMCYQLGIIDFNGAIHIK